MSNTPMLEVVIWDANGNVLRETTPASVASQEEIDAMVGLILTGTPAYVAASIVLPSGRAALSMEKTK